MEMKYHAQFLLDKEKENPTAKLRYRIKWENNIVAFNLGYRVEIEKWSKETQRCKTNTTHGDKKISASVINKKIQQYELACENVFRKFELEGNTPNPDAFRGCFNIEIGKTPKTGASFKKSFFEVYDLFISEESKINQWKAGTIRRMNGQRKKIEKFNADIDFNSLDESGLIRFQEFLELNENKNTTILKEFKTLKWFLRWAKKKGYNHNTDFESFKPKIKITQKKIIFLTQTELKKLKEYTIPDDKKYLEKVRDIFLFQCFTGLRYSDVSNLRKSDIKNNHIEVTTVKTLDSLMIELNDYSRKILKKYENVGVSNGKALPIISNQKMNDLLKELAELAGINESIRETYYAGNKRVDEVFPKYTLLGTHAGRRTFICNALSLGIPAHVVMKWTGHSDYKSMKPYIDIADEIKANAMERFNTL